MDINGKMASAGGKKLSIASLCVGGGSVIFFEIPLLGLAAAIVGLILAIKSSKMCREEGVTTGFASGGLAASIGGIVIGAIWNIWCCTCVGCYVVSCVSAMTNSGGSTYYSGW